MKRTHLIVTIGIVCALLLVALLFYYKIFKPGPSTASSPELIANLIPGTNHPLLVTVIMIKDEEPVIEATLEPFIRDGLDAFFIFDTGSTDNTIQVVKDCFAKHNITRYFIGQEPFVDFATSRNRGLDLAKEKFPNAGFLLMPDAEWHINNGQGLLKFCKEKVNDPMGAHIIRITSPTLDFYTPRLLRTNNHIRFVGAVHEVPNYYTESKVPADVYFDLKGSKYGSDKSIRRWTRDKELLLKDHHQNPQNPRTLFYLAQTCHCLADIGDYELYHDAYKYYSMRTQVPGWAPETFIAWYRLGQVAERLNTKYAEKYPWETAQANYLKGFSLAPHRAEPLVKIAQYYLLKGDMATAFLYAKRACEIPYPKEDVLFVDKDLYHITRHDILAQCSWYIGEFETGEKAARDALLAYPHDERLNKNLAFYVERKKQLAQPKTAIA